MERKYYFFISIFLTLIIGWGSLAPIGDSMPSTISISDKAIHILAYFLLTLSWLFSYKKESKKLKVSIIILVIVFIYGIIIEVLQGTVTKNRQPEAYDLLANLTGIILAITVFKQGLQKNF
ncbi:VanZ family protein [Lutibacter flavus]|uniref:VanZ like family protein n=1 Tax=Lutibacter flavus TaxID=691689 RepID=A0A238XCQ3_9FLAO|nr:VanZ family protein [Lutibacter flavus]SNR56273.1 VanZ like family protein [Lutibacter flavus]